MPPDHTHLLLFLTATIILNLTPGNDVLYVASQSIHHKKLGIFAALGISTGISIYIAATAFGLANVLQHSIFLFDSIKIIGALYLIYIAWKTFFQPPTGLVLNIESRQQHLTSYCKGIYTTLLNPKVGLFFLTFLPQFVVPSQGEAWLQFLSLGIFFIISGTIINVIYALLFSQLKERVFSKAVVQKWLNKITALLFLTIACKIFFAKKT